MAWRTPNWSSALTSCAITVSIPSRYVHTVNEMISVADLDAAATLLARYLEDAHNGDYTL